MVALRLDRLRHRGRTSLKKLIDIASSTIIATDQNQKECGPAQTPEEEVVDGIHLLRITTIEIITHDSPFRTTFPPWMSTGDPVNSFC